MVIRESSYRVRLFIGTTLISHAAVSVAMLHSITIGHFPQQVRQSLVARIFVTDSLSFLYGYQMAHTIRVAYVYREKFHVTWNRHRTLGSSAYHPIVVHKQSCNRVPYTKQVCTAVIIYIGQQIAIKQFSIGYRHLYAFEPFTR